MRVHDAFRPARRAACVTHCRGLALVDLFLEWIHAAGGDERFVIERAGGIGTVAADDDHLPHIRQTVAKSLERRQ